jgi:hypothetical protein
MDIYYQLIYLLLVNIAKAHLVDAAPVPVSEKEKQ